MVSTAIEGKWKNGVKVTFSTDMDYWWTGDTRSRGEMTIAFLSTWKAAGIPSPTS